MLYNQKYFTEQDRKAADKERLRRWTEKHPERAKMHWKKYRDANRKQIIQKQRKARADDPEKFREYAKQYRQSSPKRFLSKKLSNIKGRILAAKLLNARSKNRRRKKVLDIDINVKFLTDLFDSQKGRCAISQHLMTLEFKSPYGVSIDRIDSSRGYTKDNVQLVCQVINFGKNTFSNEEMLEFWKNRPIGPKNQDDHS